MTRMARLDALRAFCVIGVFLYHAHLLDYGWVGVQVFFVLSGFLITGVLLDDRSRFEAKAFFARFYARRALRIFPAYYAFLLVFLAIAAVGLAPPKAAAGFLAEFPWLLVYLENLRSFAPGYVNSSAYSHLWTLSVEEQFYLVWPLAIWLTPTARLQRLCLAVLATGVVFRMGFATYAFIAAQGTTLLSFAVSRAPFCVVDAFAIGALALLARRGATDALSQTLLVTMRATVYGAAAFAALALLLAPAGAIDAALASPALLDLLTLAFGLPLLNLIAIRIILALATAHAGGGRVLALFDIPALQRLGVISYGFYIYHDPVLLLTRTAMSGSHLATLLQPIVAFALTTLAAAMSYRYIEIPFLTLKDRLPWLAGRGGETDGSAVYALAGARQ